MIKKFVNTVAVAIVAVFMMFFSVTATNAEEPGLLDQAEVEHLKSFFDEYGVDSSTQETLIEKLDQGLPWDSFSPGMEPVGSQSSSSETHTLTIDTYADGSISVTTVEIPRLNSGGIQPLGVSGCVRTDSGTFASYWTNCHVVANTGAIEMGFYVNYENVKGVGSQITNYWGYHYYIVGGTLTNHSLDMLNSKTVRYSAHYQSVLMPVGFSVWVQANLNGAVLTMSHS